MISTLFGIESLAICCGLGLLVIAFSCAYFFLMLVYAIIAECYNLPMPLDTHYFIGKFNGVVWMGSMIIGLILFIL